MFESSFFALHGVTHVTVSTLPFGNEYFSSNSLFFRLCIGPLALTFMIWFLVCTQCKRILKKIISYYPESTKPEFVHMEWSKIN